MQPESAEEQPVTPATEPEVQVPPPVVDQTVINSDQRPIGGAKTGGADQMPVGGGSKFNFSQFPDENAPVKPKKPVVKKVPLKQKKEQQKIVDNSSEKVNDKQTSANQDKSQAVPAINSSPGDERPVGGGKSTFFDQAPIKSSGFNISEFPEGGPPPEESAPVALPLEQRLKSKAIKLKMSAFEELTSVIQGGDMSVAESVEWDKMLKQSNPGCLQKILLSFQKYVQNGGRWGDEQIKTLVQSGYINGKGTSKKVAWQILQHLYQKKPEVIETAIVGGLRGKVMKTVAGFISLINELLSIYGIKKMNCLKAYYPDVIKLVSNQKNPQLKTEGMNMLKEAMKWLTKDFLEPYFKQNSLKEALKKQLDQFWEEHDKATVMQAPKADVQAPAKGQSNKAGKIDVYNLSEAVDVFKKYNQKWVNDVLKTQKWNQKTRMMQEFINAATVPKIANTDFKHVIDLIKRLMNDSNMNVVLTTLKICSVMAQGLRKHFAPYAKMFFSAIIVKFKDKKTQMIDQTNKCLNEFSYCISIEDVLDDIKEGLNDKNPNMKVNLMTWIERVVERKATDDNPPAKLKEAVKGLFGIFQKLCNDGVSDVRDTTVKVIAKIRALIGQQFFLPLEAKLGKAIVGKIDNVAVDIPDRPMTSHKGNQQISLSQTMRPQTSGNNPLSKTMNLEIDRSAQKVEPNHDLDKSKDIKQSRHDAKANEKSVPRPQAKHLQRSIHKNDSDIPLEKSGYYNGDTIMPETKFLTSYRMVRQDADQSAPWNYDNILPAKQEDLLLEINRSFRKDLSNRMLSVNYKKVIEASSEILRLCKDASQQASLRQVVDIILKWIFYRLYGGSPPLALSLMEIVPLLLMILAKKNLIISESDMTLVVCILRQFSLSGIDCRQLPESVHTSIRTLVKLHSGDRVLKIVLKQYQQDISAIHKHLRREHSFMYRECLNRIIKHDLVDFVCAGDIPQTIAQIKELAKDPEFIEILYSKFSEQMLNNYGFSKDVVPKTPHRQGQHSPSNSGLNNPQLSNSQTKFSQNTSGVLHQPPLHPNTNPLQGGRTQAQTPQNQIVKTPSTGLTGSNTRLPATLPTAVSASNLYNSRGGSSTNLTPPVHQRAVTPPYHQSAPQQQIPLSSRINLSNYPCPHPSNPLNEHLSKLNPPGETTLQFFQALFAQNSQKITAQLQNYSKIILAAILKSNIDMIERRNEVSPEKLTAQLNLLQQALKNRFIIRNSGEVLAICTEFVIKQLVYEDENKTAISDALKSRGFDYKVENFIKIINGIMLRILQNGHPHQVTVTLFDYLIHAMKKQHISQKTFSLVLKCIGRVTSAYVSEIEECNLKELFLKFHQYCTELEGRLRPDDQGLQIIRNVLTEVAQQLKSNVWTIYDKAMNETNVQDEFIAKHFQSLGIPYPEKPQHTEKQQELKKISEMLSKLRTYDTGIKLLNTFLDQYPDFQIAKYFAELNYEPKFINKVLGALESNFNRSVQPPVMEPRRSEERRQRSLQRSSEDINIEQRIKGLRQRFDQIQVTKAQQPPIVQNQNQNQDDNDPDRANQIRRRITQMKARIHNVIR